jgi:hypothetical protein
MLSLFGLEPVAGEKQDAENYKGEKGEHDRDGVCRLDLAFVELREDV